MFDIFAYFKTVKKLFTKQDILMILGIIILFLLTRLINLDKFPIFNDEGIYIQWAKIAWHDATWRFISLTDGKQPLQTWATIPFLKFFPDNALLAGRLFAVSTGLIALSGIFTLLLYLFGKRAAFFGALLYVFTPYFIFYDRMALVDSGVNAAFVWILFLSIVLARTRRLDVALIMGVVGGFGLLAKSSVRIFIGLSFFGIIFFYKNLKKSREDIINFLSLISVATVISLVIYNVQRLSPFLHYVSEKNKTFLLTFDEFLKTPFVNVPGNLSAIPQFIFWESGFILPILGIAGFYVLFKKDKKLFSYLLIWFIVPFIIVLFFSKVLFPRYIIFFPTILLLTSAYLLSQIKVTKNLFIALAVFILSVVYFDYTLLYDHKNIPFPPVDRGQYIEAWPAGWGIKEIVEYARVKSSEKPVIIISEGNFGMAGDVLNVMLKRGDNISIKPYWPLEEKHLLENQKELKNNYVFVVFPHREDYPAHWPLKLIQKYDKPGGNTAIYFFELTP